VFLAAQFALAVPQRTEGTGLPDRLRPAPQLPEE
jgi:hypothetical protein